jgi:Mn2+/Fe2+ NRAMP family transporter
MKLQLWIAQECLANSFILILAGSAFHANYSDTADLTSANELLAPALG